MDHPSVGAYLIGADNVISRPVPALDQMIRPHAQDQFERRIVIKSGHKINTAQRGNNGKAVLQGIHRPFGALPSS